MGSFFHSLITRRSRRRGRQKEWMKGGIRSPLLSLEGESVLRRQPQITDYGSYECPFEFSHLENGRHLVGYIRTVKFIIRPVKFNYRWCVKFGGEKLQFIWSENVYDTNPRGKCSETRQLLPIGSSIQSLQLHWILKTRLRYWELQDMTHLNDLELIALWLFSFETWYLERRQRRSIVRRSRLAYKSFGLIIH